MIIKNQTNKQKQKQKTGIVTVAYNPSYLVGRDQEGFSLRPTHDKKKKLARPHIKKQVGCGLHT
jgi:hypothetical protein